MATDPPRKAGRGFDMARPGTPGDPGSPVAGGPGAPPEPGSAGRLDGPGEAGGEAGGSGMLDDDELIDLAAERTNSAMDEILDRLDRELVGLVPVKARIREIASLLLVDKMRRRFGLDSERPSLHMSFTGSPGTGKTTVALRMAELLSRLGYLAKGHLVSVTRDDLVGQYIGHTAPKTREVLKRAMGGVLFIDEAYYLYRTENERDYGQEAIEILLQVMENERDDLVVILAGYRDRMDTFFQANPGMGSRIAHLMLAQQGYEFSAEAEKTFAEYLTLRRSQPRFANARSVRNALERARLRQAGRLVAGTNRQLSRPDLVRIEADDIRRSRVFGPDAPEAADRS